jgi:hypothetical protein
MKHGEGFSNSRDRYSGDRLMKCRLQKVALRGANNANFFKENLLCPWLAILLAFALFISFSPLADAAGHPLNSTHMVSPGIGWAGSSTNLFWTIDGGGHWEDITPLKTRSSSIGAVFFINDRSGWVLLSDQTPHAEGSHIARMPETTGSSAFSLRLIRLTSRHRRA